MIPGIRVSYRLSEADPDSSSATVLSPNRANRFPNLMRILNDCIRGLEVLLGPLLVISMMHSSVIASIWSCVSETIFLTLFVMDGSIEFVMRLD